MRCHLVLAVALSKNAVYTEKIFTKIAFIKTLKSEYAIFNLCMVLHNFSIFN